MSAEEDQNPLLQEQPAAPEMSEEPEKYPASFNQDDVGRAVTAQPAPPKGEHLLANDGNMLARKDVRWRGGADGEKDPEKKDPEDPEEEGFKPPKSEWDEMFTTDYFTVMGFLFKMNTLRVNQKNLPLAIALLLVIYMFIACYVLYVLLGGMMIHVAIKYEHEECEQNLYQWAFVTGVYICTAFVLNVASTVIKLAWKKEPLATIQHFGTIFALVWYIIGCVRVYKLDFSSHTCPEILYKVSYYYCTVTLSVLGAAIGLICCGTAVFAARRGTEADDGI